MGVWLVLTACVAVAAAPVAVVASSERPGAQELSRRSVERVRAALTREGLTGPLDDAETKRHGRAAGLSDPQRCEGGRSCLSRLAVVLGPGAVVVGVDVARVGKQVVLH